MEPSARRLPVRRPSSAARRARIVEMSCTKPQEWRKIDNAWQAGVLLNQYNVDPSIMLIPCGTNGIATVLWEERSRCRASQTNFQVAKDPRGAFDRRAPGPGAALSSWRRFS